MILKVFTDGGSRQNPGPAASAFIVYNEKGGVIYQKGEYLGIASNNVAEYSAVISALSYLSNLGNLEAVSKIEFYLDSLLVVSQLNGLWKVKEDTLRDLKINIHGLEQTLLNRNSNLKVSYTHIPRYQNTNADLIVNQTLDLHSNS